MLKPRIILASFATILSLALSGMADTVVLKSGETVEGRILNETDAELTIEFNVTASIKDQRVIKKADVEKIERPQPDLEAWEPIKNIAVGSESLESADYQRSITLLNAFVTQFPQSAHAAEAKKKVAELEEEKKRVDAGEMKLNGNWLTAEEVKEERVQVTGRILLGRMKRHAAAGQAIEAMNAFEAITKNAPGSAGFPEAVVLARQLLPGIKAAAEQGKVQLKAQAEERKRRLDNVRGAERQQLEALQKQQIARTEAAVASYEKSGLKWLPLAPGTERSLSSISSKATTELSSLNRHNVEKMNESVQAAERAKTALADGDGIAAAQALDQAKAAWSQNEYVTRLQPKVAEAKAAAMKAEQEAKAKEAAEAAAAAAAANSASASKPKATPQPAPAAAPVATEEPVESGSVLTKPAFWVILAVIVGLAFLGKKALGKFRDPNKNILDQ